MTKKKRVPRKLKKAIKKAIVIFDISALPDHLSFDKMWEIYIEHGLLIYDSSKGNCPEFANRVGMRVKVIEKDNYKKRFK